MFLEENTDGVATDAGTTEEVVTPTEGAEVEAPATEAGEEATEETTVA